MSGHSRWSQIKHKKALTDKKKGLLFSKLSKLIFLAAKKDINPETNIELKNAIEQARLVDMPKDNIDRAIKKVSEKNQNQLDELAIGVIGPGGVALEIWAITDKKNRTLAEIKNILIENNSKLVQLESISWMFNQPAPVLTEKEEEQINKLYETLDNHGDVEKIISNLD